MILLRNRSNIGYAVFEGGIIVLIWDKKIPGEGYSHDYDLSQCSSPYFETVVLHNVKANAGNGSENLE